MASSRESIEDLVKKDPQVLLHPASSISTLLQEGPDMMVAGEGIWLTDAQGNKLLDAVAGLWCVNVGYGRQELANAFAQASTQLGYYHTFSNASNPWQVRLAERVLHHSPLPDGKIFFGNNGSDANDTAMKIAWHYHALRGYPNKIKIISRQQAYHGTSISTASLTALVGFHKKFPIPLNFIHHVGCPSYYRDATTDERESDFCARLIDEIKALIVYEGADNIAAFIAEPIMAAAGIIVPPEGYHRQLNEILQENDILLIADEVVCGYGRLGSWFGSPDLDMQPDMVSMAKGLTSGYFPLSALAITDTIWSVLQKGSEELGSFYHGYTYSGHPSGCALALANLNIIEKENLIPHAREMGAYLQAQLQAQLADHPHVGEIRGKGLLAGIQLVKDKASKQLPAAENKWPMRICQTARRHGIIFRPLPSVSSIGISPPLIIQRPDIDQIVHRLATAIDEVTRSA